MLSYSFTKMHSKFTVGNRAISKEKMAEIQAKIAADRRKLEEQKDMAEEERNKVKEDLETQENELKKYKWVKIVIIL